MSGVPPSGPRSTRGFPPLAKPVAGLRPLGSRSLTLSCHLQLAAQQAVWRGHQPGRLQGALSMKAPGSIRLGNKRAGAPGKPGPGEIAVDIDRKNRILGNPFVLTPSQRLRSPQRRYRALPRQIRSRPQMRWPHERRDRSARRTRPKGRAPGLHVLVLAEALPRRHHHRRDQTAPRMRGRATRRSRNERTPLLAILSRPALSSPNVAAEMDQAAALQARGKSPERTLVGP